MTEEERYEQRIIAYKNVLRQLEQFPHTYKTVKDVEKFLKRGINYFQECIEKQALKEMNT